VTLSKLDQLPDSPRQMLNSSWCQWPFTRPQSEDLSGPVLSRAVLHASDFLAFGEGFNAANLVMPDRA
jgi:hypothetical protein